MNKYKIYFLSENISELIKIDMVAENVNDVRRKFREKYPYDEIYEITLCLDSIEECIIFINAASKIRGLI